MREELTAVSGDRRVYVGVSTRCRRGKTGERSAAIFSAGNAYKDIQHQ